jgi:hypothetical protein
MPCILIPFSVVGPLLEIGIAAPVSLAPHGAPPTPITWIKAIADTGCSHTALFSGVATAAGLPIIGKTQVHNTSQIVSADIYLGDLIIRCGLPGNRVFEFPFRDRRFTELLQGGPNHNALLGMDILGLGVFTTNGLLASATFCW